MDRHYGHYEDFLGERVRIIYCEVGVGVAGVPVGPGPQLTFKEDGRDVLVDTLLIRDVAWDDGRVEVVALIVGKNCRGEVERMVAMAAEKMASPGCAMARVSRVPGGWQVAGWRASPSDHRRCNGSGPRRSGARGGTR